MCDHALRGETLNLLGPYGSKHERGRNKIILNDIWRAYNVKGEVQSANPKRVPNMVGHANCTMDIKGAKRGR
jgi:hypothetical protein